MQNPHCTRLKRDPAPQAADAGQRAYSGVWPNKAMRDGAYTAASSTVAEAEIHEATLARHIKSTRAPIASASFHLRARCGMGGFKGRRRPRGAASRNAKDREQDEENANCSPIVGHRSPIRVSQLAARKRRDFATILTKINRL